MPYNTTQDLVVLSTPVIVHSTAAAVVSEKTHTDTRANIPSEHSVHAVTVNPERLPEAMCVCIKDVSDLFHIFYWCICSIQESCGVCRSVYMNIHDMFH